MGGDAVAAAEAAVHAVVIGRVVATVVAVPGDVAGVPCRRAEQAHIEHPYGVVRQHILYKTNLIYPTVAMREIKIKFQMVEYLRFGHNLWCSGCISCILLDFRYYVSAMR